MINVYWMSRKLILCTCNAWKARETSQEGPLAPITYMVLDNDTWGPSNSLLLPRQLGLISYPNMNGPRSSSDEGSLLFFACVRSPALGNLQLCREHYSHVRMRRLRHTTVKKHAYTPGLPDSRAHVLLCHLSFLSRCSPLTSSFFHWHPLGAC